MEALLYSDPASRFFPFASPIDLAALQLVSRRAAAVLCREQPWERWINGSNLVERAELHPHHARRRASLPGRVGVRLPLPHPRGDSLQVVRFALGKQLLTDKADVYQQRLLRSKDKWHSSYGFSE